MLQSTLATSTLAFRSGLRRHALSSLVLQGLALFFTLATGVVLARVLGPAEYGAWAVSLAAATSLGTVAALGLPNLLTRRVAEHQSRQEWNALGSVVARSMRLAAACSVGLSLGAALLAYALGSIGGAGALLFTAAVAALPFTTLTNTWGAALRGLGHGVLAQALPTLLRPLILLAGVSGAVFLLAMPANALLATLINLVGAVLALVGTVVLYHRVRPRELAAATASESVPNLWRESLPFMLVSIVGVVSARVELFLVGALVNAHAAGLYEVAYRGADLVLLPLTATTAVLAPEYAKRYALRDTQSLQRLVTQSSRGLLLLSAPIALVLILLAGPVIRLVFGVEYGASAQTMAILAAGSLLVLCAGPVHVVLGMTGHSRTSAVGALLGVIVATLLSLLLIPRFGIEGAALAHVAGMGLAACWLVWWTQRAIGIRTSALVARRAP